MILIYCNILYKLVSVVIEVDNLFIRETGIFLPREVEDHCSDI